MQQQFLDCAQACQLKVVKVRPDHPSNSALRSYDSSLLPPFIAQTEDLVDSDSLYKDQFTIVHYKAEH